MIPFELSVSKIDCTDKVCYQNSISGENLKNSLKRKLKTISEHNNNSFAKKTQVF